MYLIVSMGHRSLPNTLKYLCGQRVLVAEGGYCSRFKWFPVSEQHYPNNPLAMLIIVSMEVRQVRGESLLSLCFQTSDLVSPSLSVYTSDFLHFGGEAVLLYSSQSPEGFHSTFQGGLQKIGNQGSHLPGVWAHNHDSDNVAQLHRHIIEKQEAYDQIDFSTSTSKTPLRSFQALSPLAH